MRWSDLVLYYAERFRWWLLGATVLNLALAFTGQWRPEPDAGLYLSLGRNLAEGYGYTYHGEAHRLAYPGWPWVLAGVFKVSSSHAVAVAHGLVFAIGLACLALMYRLVRLHADRATAVLATMGLGVSYTFYRYCFELRNDLPFFLGVMMVLAGYEAIVKRARRAWINWLLLIVGLLMAVVMRPTMWALLGALCLVVIGQMLRGRFAKRTWVLLLIVPVTAAAFVLLDPRRQAGSLGDYEDVLIQRLSPALLASNAKLLIDPMAGEAMFGADFGDTVRLGGFSLNAISGLIAMGVGVWAFKHRALWGWLFVLGVLIMLLVLPQPRYFLPVLPVLVIGWWRLIRQINLRLPNRRWANGVFLFLFALGAVPNAAKTGGLWLEQRRRDPLEAYNRGDFVHVHELARTIEAATPADAWIIAPKKFGRVLTFLSRRNVVELFEAPNLDESDRPVFVLDPMDDAVWGKYSARIQPPIATSPGKKTWTLHPVSKAEGR